MEGRVPYTTEYGRFGTFTRKNGQYGVYYIGQIQVFLPESRDEPPRLSAQEVYCLITSNPRLVLEFLDGHEAVYDPDDFKEEFDEIIGLPEVPKDTRLTDEELSELLSDVALELMHEKMQEAGVM